MKIKIAPNLNEVTLEKNVVSAEFNGMTISYTMPEDQYLEKNPLEVKQNLREGIALSSNLWFLEDLLNHHYGWEGKLTVGDNKTNELLYGKE